MESNKATVAGILDITSGIFGFVGGIPLLALALGGSILLGTIPEPEANAVAFLPMVIFLPLALLCLLAGIVAIMGGMAALNRRRWGLSVAGSIAAVFSFLPLGIIAVIFTILAEPEFRAGPLVSESSDVNG
ncbi:MAG: hypothetical protein V2I67_08210 [Thermoanaerobaculales bacterium]|jgi:hypothetical protein|nr:hypothetical protein [Thermoanaerobaculales bacterium]